MIHSIYAATKINHIKIIRNAEFSRPISCNPNHAHKLTNAIGIQITIAMLNKNLMERRKLITTNLTVIQMF